MDPDIPPRNWYSADGPLLIWCRGCGRECRLLGKSVVERCPRCDIKTKDGGDWWQLVKPETRIVKGMLTDRDKDYLRCERIAAWEGGIETE